MGVHVAPRPDADPPDWYDDRAWESGDDAHRVSFEPVPRRCPPAYPLTGKTCPTPVPEEA